MKKTATVLIRGILTITRATCFDALGAPLGPPPGLTPPGGAFFGLWRAPLLETRFGSSMIEGACHNLIDGRVERTGMGWIRKGAKRIRWLTAAFIKKGWADFWSFR
jgi:hypothetical protein